MKTRTTIILAFLGLGILGGANFIQAQTSSNYAPVCIDDEEEEIEFSVTGIDPEPGDPGYGKGPILMPTLWQNGYLLDFHGTHEDYVLRIVDATDSVVYSSAVPSYQIQVWLPTTLSGTYRIELLTDNYLFYGYISL
jgi:hypothetical protein